MIIRIPKKTPLANARQRMHWAKRAKESRVFAWYVRAELADKAPSAPLAACHISIIRYQRRGPLADRDGIIGGFKSVLDILQVMHPTRNPLGLGVIEHDGPDCVLSISAEPARGDDYTEIHITAAEPHKPAQGDAGQ
jgi:hypothetical protein